MTRFASLPSQIQLRSRSCQTTGPLTLHKKRLGMKIDGPLCLCLVLLSFLPSAQTPDTFLAQIMHRDFIVPNPPRHVSRTPSSPPSFYATLPSL